MHRMGSSTRCWRNAINALRQHPCMHFRMSALVQIHKGDRSLIITTESTRINLQQSVIIHLGRVVSCVPGIEPMSYRLDSFLSCIWEVISGSFVWVIHSVAFYNSLYQLLFIRVRIVICVYLLTIRPHRQKRWWTTLFFRLGRKLASSWWHFHTAITLATTWDITALNRLILLPSDGLIMERIVVELVFCVFWMHIISV